MSPVRRASASVATVASLGALYVIVIVFIAVLSGRLIQQPVAQSPYYEIFIALAVVFPVILLVAVGVFVFRLIRDRREGRPGSTVKARLAMFFALVVVMASVPQGIVSVNFLRTSMNLVFGADVGGALQSGLSMALQYYDAQVRLLEHIEHNGVFDRIVDPEDWSGSWERAQQVIPTVASIQTFDESGDEVFYSGSESHRMSYSAARSFRLNAVTRSTVSEGGVLRLVVRRGEGTAGEYLVVLTTPLPPAFDQRAAQLSDAVRLVNQLERLRPTLVFTVAFIYLGFAAPVFLLALLASFLLSDRLMRPIENLEEATRRVAEGDYSVRILTRASDDLGLLVMSFNRMVMELERSRKIVAQSEKVAAWQEIARRLAHEVKNPLTPIRLAAERLRRRYEQRAENFSDVLDRTVDTIIREVEALTHLLDEFRSLSSAPNPKIEVTPIREIVEKVAAVFEGQPNVSIRLESVDPAIQVPVDRNQIRQVFLNLFTNSAEASPDGVVVQVSANLVRRAQSQYCRIRVEDNGPGVAETDRTSIFDPYFTTKPHGTGLGLAICSRVIFDHHGQIWLDTATGSGTTVFFDLPMEQHETSPDS